MTKIEKSLKIQATPDEVWKVLGEPARAPEYVPGILKARMEGTQRICIDANGNEIREEISNYSDEQQSYHFRHLQVPLPVKYSQGRFAVSADGDQAVVSMEWDFEPLDPATTEQLAPMLDGAAKMTLDNLSQRVQALSEQTNHYQSAN